MSVGEYVVIWTHMICIRDYYIGDMLPISRKNGSRLAKRVSLGGLENVFGKRDAFDLKLVNE